MSLPDSSNVLVQLVKKGNTSNLYLTAMHNSETRNVQLLEFNGQKNQRWDTNKNGVIKSAIGDILLDTNNFDVYTHSHNITFPFINMNPPNNNTKWENRNFVISIGKDGKSVNLDQGGQIELVIQSAPVMRGDSVVFESMSKTFDFLQYNSSFISNRSVESKYVLIDKTAGGSPVIHYNDIVHLVDPSDANSALECAQGSCSLSERDKRYDEKGVWETFRIIGGSPGTPVMYNQIVRLQNTNDGCFIRMRDTSLSLECVSDQSNATSFAIRQITTSNGPSVIVCENFQNDGDDPYFSIKMIGLFFLILAYFILLHS